MQAWLPIQFPPANAYDVVFDALCPLKVDPILLRGVLRARLAIDQLELDCVLGEPVPQQFDQSPPPLRHRLIDDRDTPHSPHNSSRTLSVSAIEWVCKTNLL